MSEKQVFEYAFIRLVPKVEREEFLNVGVILFCKRKKYLRVKYHLNPEKTAAFAPLLDREEIEEYLKTWELISSGDPEGGPVAQLDQASRFRWLTAVRSTVIQSSKVHPGLCDNPEKLMEDLFVKYVL
ncbi:MAG: DUF3037 domain-containing protein [Bacteroidia bacterium]|nr:DUF3037 domain-containing protein [Bacteroidia bacterium]